MTVNSRRKLTRHSACRTFPQDLASNVSVSILQKKKEKSFFLTVLRRPFVGVRCGVARPRFPGAVTFAPARLWPANVSLVPARVKHPQNYGVGSHFIAVSPPHEGPGSPSWANNIWGPAAAIPHGGEAHSPGAQPASKTAGESNSPKCELVSPQRVTVKFMGSNGGGRLQGSEKKDTCEEGRTLDGEGKVAKEHQWKTK